MAAPVGHLRQLFKVLNSSVNVCFLRHRFQAQSLFLQPVYKITSALPGRDEGISEQDVGEVLLLLLCQDHSAEGSSDSEEGTSGPRRGGLP